MNMDVLCFFLLPVADCMLCVAVLNVTILSGKGGAPAGLLDQKKGKFSWFSHSTETHGNVPRALGVRVGVGPSGGAGGIFPSFGWRGHVCACVCIHACASVRVYVRARVHV